MKQFRRKSILFVLILLSTHFILLFVYKSFERKSNLVSTFNAFEANPVKKKFLFLGSSHTKRSIDTSIVKSSLSLAFYGQNNINAYDLLKYILKKYPNHFTYVCLPNDFGYYSNRFASNLNNMYFYHRFFDYSEYGSIIKQPYKNQKEAIIQDYFPYVNLKKMIKNHFVRKRKENIAFSSLNENEKNQSALTYLNEIHGIQNSKDIYSRIAILYLEKTISLLKKSNQKAIFINYPHTKTLQRNIDKIKPETLKSDTIIKQAGFKIIDLSKSLEDHDEYFFDSHHLNKKGTKYASKIIQKELSKY